MRRRILLAVLLAPGVLTGCGGGGGSAGSPPPSRTPAAPGLSGLERAVAAAHAAVTLSQKDAARASSTGAGP